MVCPLRPWTWSWSKEQLPKRALFPFSIAKVPLFKKREMTQEIKEPCKKEACDIQACLSKNNFMSQRCVGVIEKLQSCCEKCKYKSTHCGSVAGLLKQIQK